MLLNTKDVPPVATVDARLDAAATGHARSIHLLPLFVCSSTWVIVRNYP
jgi:hypothetical protein